MKNKKNMNCPNEKSFFKKKGMRLMGKGKRCSRKGCIVVVFLAIGVIVVVLIAVVSNIVNEISGAFQPMGMMISKPAPTEEEMIQEIKANSHMSNDQ